MTGVQTCALPIFGTPVSRSDVAVMMIQLKLARIKTSPEHADHWMDVAGYAACGGEVVLTPQAINGNSNAKEQPHD